MQEFEMLVNNRKEDEAGAFLFIRLHFAWRTSGCVRRVGDYCGWCTLRSVLLVPLPVY